MCYDLLRFFLCSYDLFFLFALVNLKLESKALIWAFGSSFFLSLVFLINGSLIPKSYGGHRSHFGSRYPFRLKRLASLFLCGGSIPLSVFFLFPTPLINGSLIPKSYGGHRSHFGSRYPFRLKRLASLFVCGGSIPRSGFFFSLCCFFVQCLR